MLDRRLYTDFARELWNDLSFIEKRIKEQRDYIFNLTLLLQTSRERFLELLSDANFILRKFASRRYVLREIEAGDWHRASGEVPCSECDKHYNRHPNVEGFEWLTILCDGSLVKL